MPVGPIPRLTPIVNKLGRINLFFRERWEEVRNATASVPARAIVELANQNASILTGLLFNTTQAGYYRVTFTARRTAVDGVASTLTFTWHWTDGGAPLSDTATVNATDTTGSLYTGTRMFPCDASIGLTYDMAYTSNTPGAMKFKIGVTVEFIVQAGAPVGG